MSKVVINWELHPRKALEYALTREFGRPPTQEEVDRILDPLWGAFRVWVERYGWPGEVDSPTTLARRHLLAYKKMRPDMTQMKIAHKIGVSQSVVSRLLTGKTLKLHRRTLTKFLDGLGELGIEEVN